MRDYLHEEIIGAGVANLFIERMKLEGWLPIKEYFKMRRLGIELDWVLVLTMESDNGFVAIPMVAEFRKPIKGSGLKAGWYKDGIDNPCQRLDDWTNVIMFRLIDKSNIDAIKDSILNEYIEKEGITNTPVYNKSFTNTTIELCKGKQK